MAKCPLVVNHDGRYNQIGMYKKLTYRAIDWIDLESPSAEELKTLGAEYHLHPLVISELAGPSLRSRVDVYHDFIYLVLLFPFCQICYGQAKPVTRDYQEVDFIIGRNFLITAHYELVNPLNDFAKILESDLHRPKTEYPLHGGFLFYYIIREIYGTLELGLDFINNRLRQVEKKVFADKEREVVRTLAAVNRDLIDFRWALKTHRELLSSLELAGEEMFGGEFRYYLRAISGEFQKIWQAVESNRDTFFDLRQTTESLLSIKTNETIKILTVVAFLVLPVTLISQIFGMNTSLPLVATPYDFYSVLGLMLFTVVVLYYWARTRKWF